MPTDSQSSRPSSAAVNGAWTGDVYAQREDGKMRTMGTATKLSSGVTGSSSSLLTSSQSGNDNRDAQIQVFARMRPSKRVSRNYAIDDTRGAIEFTIARDASLGYINNQREAYEYSFSGVFDTQTTQADMFDAAARPVVLSALEGYNGTIFAYGQTGSGKTFTITGGPDRYEDRGLIPRALSLVFQEINKRTDCSYTVRVSYLEIYNNAGYDLLDPEHETKNLEDLPKVSIQEDDEGNMHLKNLGLLPVTCEEEALNLLFVGDTNRVICATPSNPDSSRSHCVFTISIEARQLGASTLRKSKLHLVDLAGSERIKKTQVNGRILNEAQAINLSLHYLEQVIVALHERAQGKRVHIPYRNSMMTTVLRDSLGGNCKTVMIATLSPEDGHMDESISTCRFAQRVALIKNSAEINEESDPKLLIQQLKQQLKEQREEILVLRGERGVSDLAVLSAEEQARCAQLVEAFVADRSTTSINDPNRVKLDLTHPGKVQFAFERLRSMIHAASGKAAVVPGNGAANITKASSSPKHATVPAASSPVDLTAFQEEIRRLRLMVQARDNDIAILVNMVKQRAGERDASVFGVTGQTGLPSSAAVTMPMLSAPVVNPFGASMMMPMMVPAMTAPVMHPGVGPLHRSSGAAAASTVSAPATVVPDKAAAFEEFRQQFGKAQSFEEHKNVLREKYSQAKGLGESVNAARTNINTLKAQLDRARMARGMQSLVPGNEQALLEDGPEEVRIRAQMEDEKKRYRDHFSALKALKAEIEHLQHVAETARQRLQRDFEQWYKDTHARGNFPAGMPTSNQQQTSTSAASAHGSSLSNQQPIMQSSIQVQAQQVAPQRQAANQPSIEHQHQDQTQQFHQQQPQQWQQQQQLQQQHIQQQQQRMQQHQLAQQAQRPGLPVAMPNGVPVQFMQTAAPMMHPMYQPVHGQPFHPAMQYHQSQQQQTPAVFMAHPATDPSATNIVRPSTQPSAAPAQVYIDRAYATNSQSQSGTASAVPHNGPSVPASPTGTVGAPSFRHPNYSFPQRLPQDGSSQMSRAPGGVPPGQQLLPAAAVTVPNFASSTTAVGAPVVCPAVSTGHPAADADLASFYRIREQMLQQMQAGAR